AALEARAGLRRPERELAGGRRQGRGRPGQRGRRRRCGGRTVSERNVGGNVDAGRVRGGRPLGVVLGVLGVVLVLAIVAAVRLVPDHERRTGPLVTKGEVGSAVDTGGFVLNVSRVRVTKELASPPDDLVADPPRRTDGLWVVLDATLTGDWEA